MRPFPRAIASALGLLGAFLLSLSEASCAREGAPPVAPVEVAIPDLPDSGKASMVPIASASRSRDRCSAHLSASAIRTASGCTLDEQISKGEGTLSYPCSGDGAASAGSSMA